MKLLLFVNYIIIRQNKPNRINELLEPIIEFSKFVGYSINLHNIIQFIYSCISLSTNDFQHFFVCILASGFHLFKLPVYSLNSFFNGIAVLFLGICFNFPPINAINFLYILESTYVFSFLSAPVED